MNKNIKKLPLHKLINEFNHDFLHMVSGLQSFRLERKVISLLQMSYLDNEQDNTPEIIVKRIERFFPYDFPFICKLKKQTDKIKTFFMANDGFNKVRGDIKVCEEFQKKKKEFFFSLISKI